MFRVTDFVIHPSQVGLFFSAIYMPSRHLFHPHFPYMHMGQVVLFDLLSFTPKRF